MADKRIQLYHNLSVMLNAGVPIVRALRQGHISGKYGHLFSRIEQDVANGTALADAFERYQKHFAPLDIALIRVGEETGQIAEMFEALSQWYAFRQRLINTIRLGMLLPVFYIHAAAVLIPVVPFALGGWDWSIYFEGMFAILALAYIPALTIWAVVYLTPRRSAVRRILDNITLAIPLVGKAVRELSLSRYCNTFSITYKAGVPILQCAAMAADSVANSVIRSQLVGAYQKVKAGQEMSEGFSRRLPAEFINIWQVGEESCQLDESAYRLGRMHAENAERHFTMLARIFPFMVYIIVIVLISFFIIMAYSRIYGRLIV